MAAPATRCPVHAEFDPLGDEFLRDPFALMGDLPPDQAVPFHPNISFRGPQALWVQA